MTERSPLLAALISGFTGPDRERQVLTLLRSCSTHELNTLLNGVDMADLFDNLDNRLIGPDNQTALIQLLCHDRRPELTLANRAGLIYGMQAGFTTHEMQRAIRHIILAESGANLTTLKNIINTRKDEHDLEGLLWHDIDDRAIRQEILAHFAAEAAGVVRREARVISDIDDTVFCQLHDQRYPRGIVYPGILALLEALDAGPDDRPRSVGDLTFVTARPNDIFGIIESASRRALAGAGVATPSVIGGSFLAIHSGEVMAAQKLENIQHQIDLFPEYHIVFFGDSGQGDLLVAAGLWDDQAHHLKAVFIHDVRQLDAARRASYTRQQIHLVDTYVGAATIARNLGLISDTGWQRVAAEARQNVATIAWESDAQRTAIETVLARDIAAGQPESAV